MQYDRLTASPAESVNPSSSPRLHRINDGVDDVSPAALRAENKALRTELNGVELERAKLLETQRRIMDLLGVQAPDRLVHDLRNLLNERALLKALVDVSE